MNKKKIALITTAIAVIIFCFYKGAELFSPGSYGYAEKYELPYPQEAVKKAIIKFKLDNIEYAVPKTTVQSQGAWDLVDEPTKEPPYWYAFYFYYKNENKILLTLTRSLSNDKTTLAFVSVNDGLNLGNWKRVNKDFDRATNEEQKSMFEKRILSKIVAEINRK